MVDIALLNELQLLHTGFSASWIPININATGGCFCCTVYTLQITHIILLHTKIIIRPSKIDMDGDENTITSPAAKSSECALNGMKQHHQKYLASCDRIITTKTGTIPSAVECDSTGGPYPFPRSEFSSTLLCCLYRLPIASCSTQLCCTPLEGTCLSHC